MQGHAVHNRAHGMFADAVHQVIAVVIVGFNRFHSFDKSQVGSRQIGRTADNFRHCGNNFFQTQLRSFAGGNFGLLFNRLFFEGI